MPRKSRNPTDSERTAGTTQVLQFLADKLQYGAPHIGVYGLGYVGLPLALRFAEVGVRVTGFDIDSSKVELLNSGKSYIERITPAQIQKAHQAGFIATTDFTVTTELDAQIICVPTPLDQHYQPDLSFVINTVESILSYFREGQLLSLESTTCPGTTEEIIKPRLRSQGFVPGKSCALVYSPEREDPGTPDFTTADIPKVIGGIAPSCLENSVRHCITAPPPQYPIQYRLGQ